MNYSIAVFPFLKTSGSISLGGFRFRSTKDLSGLDEAQCADVSRIAEMLFSKDDWLIDSATYAVIPAVEPHESSDILELLEDIQSVVSFLYTAPRHEFGDVFLSSEHSTMVIFTPAKISIVSQNSNPGAVKIGAPPQELDDRLTLSQLLANTEPGFEGVYNFRHTFQVVAGSRLYGPMPRMVLNISQDLSVDLSEAFSSDSSQAAAYRLLLKQLTKHSGERSNFLTAIRWYRMANLEANSEDSAILYLSVAFESLLGLPHDDKTERLVDSISLLLGRVSRLSTWARQFYNARSRVVHEGRLVTSAFVAADDIKKGQVDLPFYQSLASYGREIFEMCLGTLLFGADMARASGLEHKFVSNEERLRDIVMILNDKVKEPQQKLNGIQPLVELVVDYQYVPDKALKIETMLGCIRAGAGVMLSSYPELPDEFEAKLKGMVDAKRSDDNFDQLDALRDLADAFDCFEIGIPDFYPIRDLVKYVWGRLFQYYYWSKSSRQK